ncbi:pentatricopeptide repeat-containing protein-like [Iris pallida]|uniref:Pentatricopeptide repeat-containing protein-like n=1 Tax=Iris pallida TaxID=29817 RepID=A0AAX6IFM8_IRIPA|nr:pentatricopeptide repeat-containing protein-like [Iris pallida]
MATSKWLKLPHPRPPPTDHPVLSLLSQAPQQEHLRALHARAVTSGLIADTFAASRLVQHFLPLDLRYAESVFDSLHHPDAYTWNAMIAGHISHSSPPRRCVSFYFRMRAAAPRAPPNSHSFALLLKSCIASADKQQAATARLVHGQVLKCGFEDDIIIKNSLMRMYINMGLLAPDARSLFDASVFLDAVSWNTMVSAYGKSGNMATARELFDRMPERTLVSWSTLLDGYLGAGDSAEALRVFRGMREDGVRPDSVALVSALKACARSGALEDGRGDTSVHRRPE